MTATAPRYSIDTFPTFGQRMDGLIASGLLVASREVLWELRRRDEDLHVWFKARGAMLIEIDDAVRDRVIALMSAYPKFVDERTGKSAGDPFVSALAAVHTPQLTVISEEQGGTLDRPKIPVVCQAEKVPCANLLQMIRELGWRI